MTDLSQRSDHPCPPEDPVLTRALIEANGIASIVARDAPDLRLLTEAELTASLMDTLAARPSGDVWLFGYGSLIWNPTIHSEERHTARIEGWHRSFCLSASAGRGSVANPGLFLGLDHGGHCAGVAFRLAEAQVETELSVLWKREMLSGAYIPRWLALHDEQDRRFGHALAFTINPTNNDYAGGLRREVMLRRLATARGALGSSAEYLFKTCEGLRASGIPDPALEQIATDVRALQTTLDTSATGHRQDRR